MFSKPLLIICILFTNLFFLIGQENDIDSIQYSGDNDWDLLNAAYYNDSVKLFELLKDGADVNFKTYEGITALMYAVENDHLLNTKVLVANGADIDMVPFMGDPPLITSCLNDNFDIAEYLIRKDADINITNLQGLTPLLEMIKYENYYMVDMLLYYEASADKADREGNTPLIIAIKQGNEDIINLLIRNNADLNKSDRSGFTPLMICCEEGNYNIANQLLKSGANIDLENGYGYDALAIAIKNGHLEIVKLLIENGADVNKDYGNKMFPSNLSTIYSYPAITHLLRTNGGKPNRKPSFNTFGMGIEMPFNFQDYLFGMQGFVYDYKYNITLESGFQFRPQAVRILDRVSDHKFYQFWERRYLLYSGIKKQTVLFPLKRISSISVNYGFKIGYTWGAYRGSDSKPDSKFIFIPNAGIFYAKDFLETGIRYEYLNFNHIQKSPHKVNFFVSFKFGSMFKQLKKSKIAWLEE